MANIEYLEDLPLKYKNGKNKNPENIAPIARIINGIIMTIGDSCMLDIFNFLLL